MALGGHAPARCGGLPAGFVHHHPGVRGSHLEQTRRSPIASTAPVRWNGPRSTWRRFQRSVGRNHRSSRARLSLHRAPSCAKSFCMRRRPLLAKRTSGGAQAPRWAKDSSTGILWAGQLDSVPARSKKRRPVLERALLTCWASLIGLSAPLVLHRRGRAERRSTAWALVVQAGRWAAAGRRE